MKVSYSYHILHSRLEYELNMLILEKDLAKSLLLCYHGQSRCYRHYEVRDKWLLSLFKKSYS